MLRPETWTVIDYRAHPAFSARAVAPDIALEQQVEALLARANHPLRVRYDAAEQLPEGGAGGVARA